MEEQWGWEAEARPGDVLRCLPEVPAQDKRGRAARQKAVQRPPHRRMKSSPVSMMSLLRPIARVRSCFGGLSFCGDGCPGRYGVVEWATTAEPMTSVHTTQGGEQTDGAGWAREELVEVYHRRGLTRYLSHGRIFAKVCPDTSLSFTPDEVKGLASSLGTRKFCQGLGVIVYSRLVTVG